jgi:hypothetical protein
MSPQETTAVPPGEAGQSQGSMQSVTEHTPATGDMMSLTMQVVAPGAAQTVVSTIAPGPRQLS